MVNPIRTHRRRIGLTIAELAAAAGVSTSLIAVWERGDHCPSPERQKKLAQLLGVDGARLASELGEFRVQLTQRARQKLAAVT